MTINNEATSRQEWTVVWAEDEDSSPDDVSVAQWDVLDKPNCCSTIHKCSCSAINPAMAAMSCCVSSRPLYGRIMHEMTGDASLSSSKRP